MEFASYLPFWNGLTAAQQAKVAEVIELRTVKKGDCIHDSSAECLGLVIMHSGQLRAYILSEDGREITVGRLLDYDVSLLSASCVMPDLQFNVMIEAEKDSRFWSIPACLFKNLADESLAVSNYSRSLISGNLSELEYDPRKNRQPYGNRPGGGHPDAALFPKRGNGAPDPGRN